MYRSNLEIKIDDEFETDISSTDLNISGINEGESLKNKPLSVSFKIGISAFSMLAMVNTIHVEGPPTTDFNASSVLKQKIGNLVDEKVYIDLPKENDALSAKQYDNAIAGLENLWKACPDDAPTDLSINHNTYLYLP